MGTINDYDAPSGTYITATTTVDGNTSEFSPCIQSTALPRLTLSEEAVEVEEDGSDRYIYLHGEAGRPGLPTTPPWN